MPSTAIDVRSLSKQYDLEERHAGAGSGVRRQRIHSRRCVMFPSKFASMKLSALSARDGAGKSHTAQDFARGVTAPTQGRARIRGRMGTILEVGTGFHPELIGQENVYPSGTILDAEQVRDRPKVRLKSLISAPGRQVRRYAGQALFVRHIRPVRPRRCRISTLTS